MISLDFKQSVVSTPNIKNGPLDNLSFEQNIWVTNSQILLAYPYV